MLDHLSVEETQKNINKGQISIKEVLVYYLDRIEKFNKDINAIVLQKDRELLIKEAEQKDNLRSVNKILNGLPIAVKDLSDVVGLKTTYGYEGSKNNSPKKNSLFVDKLIDEFRDKKTFSKNRRTFCSASTLKISLANFYLKKDKEYLGK